MQTTVKTDVVIIGAGPTGLAFACQLVRHNIDFIIIDKNEGLTPFSKAIGVQARTIEIYEQIGLAEKAVAQGRITGKARMLESGEVRAELNLSNLGEGLSAYPYLLLLEQSKNEKLHYEFLQTHGKKVLWNTAFESLSQTETGVSAEVKAADGSSQRIEGKYLVGCDGPKSMVRHALGLEFQGSTLERLFFVADVHLDWTLGNDALNLFLSKNSLLAFFPLKTAKDDTRYRIVGTFPEEFAKSEGDILYEEIEQRIKDEAKLELDITKVEWFSTYKVHTRHVNKFSEGRCLLAGDSAHIHTPAGGQGMNTGIQDGYNLAWKLALVLREKAGAKLLETYNEERLENARNLTRSTDRMFQLLAGNEWFISFLRTNVIPSVANFLLSLDPVKNYLFPLISQIGINYRHSSLSQHAGDEEFQVKAGDRMPYFLIGGNSVYDKLHAPKFHLLHLINDSGAYDGDHLKTKLESQYDELVDFNTISLDQKVAEVFGTDKPFSVLLRPDNYIAALSQDTTLNGVGVYLNDFIGHA